MYGLHINNINDIYNYHIKYKCDTFQIFTNIINNLINNDNNNELKKILEYIKNNNIKIIIHASYSINCAKKWNKYSWWIRELIDEIKLAKYINSNMIIIHMGKKINLSNSEALNNMYSSILYIHEYTKNNYDDIKILIETPSGQGSEICYNVDDFIYFYKKIHHIDRFGICIDLCHVYVAGNNIDDFINKINKYIGNKYIYIFHINNSKKNKGEKIDRHENLNYGRINIDIIKNIIKKYSNKIYMILETPNKYIDEDINIIINYSM